MSPGKPKDFIPNFRSQCDIGFQATRRGTCGDSWPSRVPTREGSSDRRLCPTASQSLHKRVFNYCGFCMIDVDKPVFWGCIKLHTGGSQSRFQTKPRHNCVWSFTVFSFGWCPRFFEPDTYLFGLEKHCRFQKVWAMNTKITNRFSVRRLIFDSNAR